jgi:hypothetical protein
VASYSTLVEVWSDIDPQRATEIVDRMTDCGLAPAYQVALGNSSSVSIFSTLSHSVSGYSHLLTGVLEADGDLGEERTQRQV